LLLFVCSSSALQGFAADDSKDKEKLQGTWKAVSVTDNGRTESGDAVKTLKLQIKKDAYTYVIGDKNFSARFTIDPSKKPKQMDVTFEEGPQKGKTMRAIYSLDGDKLKICGGDERPTEFSAKAKSKAVLFEFERDQK